MISQNISNKDLCNTHKKQLQLVCYEDLIECQNKPLICFDCRKYNHSNHRVLDQQQLIKQIQINLSQKDKHKYEQIVYNEKIKKNKEKFSNFQESLIKILNEKAIEFDYITLEQILQTLSAKKVNQEVIKTALQINKFRIAQFMSMISDICQLQERFLKEQQSRFETIQQLLHGDPIFSIFLNDYQEQINIESDAKVVQISPNDDYIAQAEYKLIVRNTSDYYPIFDRKNDFRIQSLCFSKDSQQIYQGDSKGNLKIINILTKELVWDLHIHNDIPIIQIKSYEDQIISLSKFDIKVTHKSTQESLQFDTNISNFSSQSTLYLQQYKNDQFVIIYNQIQIYAWYLNSLQPITVQILEKDDKEVTENELKDSLIQFTHDGSQLIVAKKLSRVIYFYDVNLIDQSLQKYLCFIKNNNEIQTNNAIYNISFGLSSRIILYQTENKIILKENNTNPEFEYKEIQINQNTKKAKILTQPNKLDFLITQDFNKLNIYYNNYQLANTQIEKQSARIAPQGSINQVPTNQNQSVCCNLQ